MFWVGNQGEGTSPCCTLFFSDFRTSFSFSLWLGWWDHFTRRTETFQKISNMYGYLFVHITLHGFFSEFSVVRGGGNDGTVSTGCGSPSVLHPWMLLLHMQETALWIPPVCCVLDDICKRQLLWILRGAFCPLEGGPRHIGTDTLAPVLQFPHCKKGPGWNDPMTAVVPRVKGFACYDLSFSRHNKNIKMEHFFLYILSRYFIWLHKMKRVLMMSVHH